jgi:hypothetical protein
VYEYPEVGVEIVEKAVPGPMSLALAVTTEVTEIASIAAMTVSLLIVFIRGILIINHYGCASALFIILDRTITSFLFYFPQTI